MKMYRFSPIKSEKELQLAFEYISEELKKLSKEVLGEVLPANTLKVFAHYFDEYDFLFEAIKQKGPAAPFNSETSYYATVDQKIAGQDIKYLGVRVVDPYRLQVGCGDFEVEDFQNFKSKYLHSSKYIKEVPGDMLEIWHPDFDILGYVVPKL